MSGGAMSRAASICSTPGCPKMATTRGKCAQHKPKWINPQPWANSAPVPKGHKRWAREVLTRDGHVCRNCGARATEADHIIGRAQRPDLALDPANGQALCQTCHRAKTQSAPRVRRS